MRSQTEFRSCVRASRWLALSSAGLQSKLLTHDYTWNCFCELNGSISFANALGISARVVDMIGVVGEGIAHEKVEQRHAADIADLRRR